MNGLSVEAVREDAMKELEPRLVPVRKFIKDVKESILNGVDTLDPAIIADWMFVIPVMYGELRCLEVDCLLAAELFEGKVDKVKADSMVSKSMDQSVTEARAMAAQATHDLQVQQQVAKFMARTVNALWSQLEMLIFSVRALYESRQSNHKVKHEV